jgi:hypothetical protein
MPSKEEYKRIFNELLGVNVGWEKLNKEELASLAAIFSNPEVLLEKLGVKRDPKEKVAEGLTELAMAWEGPLIRLLKSLAERRKEVK